MRLHLNEFDLDRIAVRQRFAWAQRQGQPNWLWPDLGIQAWRDALTQIENTLRSVLSGQRETSIDGDTTSLGVAGYTSGAGPLLGLWIERQVVVAPAPVAALFELHLRHNRLRMRQMTVQTAQLAEALHTQGIPVVVLKGMHTAHVYFPDSGARPVSDIDLLVPAWAEEAAGNVLCSAGYRAGRRALIPREQTWKRPDVADQPISLSLVHADDPWSVDLHTSLDRRYSAGAPIISLDDFAPSGLPHWPVVQTANVLQQPLLFLHLAVHACCGMQSLTLVRLFELASVIRRDIANGSLVWNDFLAMADQAGALGVVYPALRLCEALAPDTVPVFVLEASRAKVPASVRRLIDPLSPASAQRVVRCSFAERFMWTSRRNILRQIAAELFPAGNSLPMLVGIYRTRMWRLARGTVTR